MNNKRNKISTIVLTAMLVLSVFAAFATPVSANPGSEVEYTTSDTMSIPATITVTDNGDSMIWAIDIDMDNAPISNGHVAYALAISRDSVHPAFQVHSNDGVDHYYAFGTHLYSEWGPTINDGYNGWHTGWDGVDEPRTANNIPVSEMGITATGEKSVVDNPDGIFTVTISKDMLTPRFSWAVQIMANTCDTYYPIEWVKWSGDASTYELGPVTTVTSAYIGEELPTNQDEGNAVGVYYKYGHIDDEVYLGTVAVSDRHTIPTKDRLEDQPAGVYTFVVGDLSNSVTMTIATITLDVPSMVVKDATAELTAKVNVPNTQTSDGTQREVTFTIANEDTPNFPVKTADAAIAGGEAVLELDTTAFVAGTYIVNAKFNKSTNDGLETKATAATFDLQESAIQIEVDKTTAVVNQKIYVTVTTSLNANITIDTTPQTDELEFVAGEGNPAPDPDTTRFYDIPDVGDDGIARVVVKFTDDGSYTLRATIAGTDDDDTVDITIDKGKITVSAPTQAVIGEKVEITGTATGTSNVNITIKDAAGEVIDTAVESVSDNEYTYEWETEGNMPATYKIYVYAGETVKASADAAASIRLTEGDLVVNVPSVTAEADTGDMKVEGTATGADEVYMLVFRNANGNCEFNEIVSVKSDDWSFEETPLSDDATKGTYTVFVIHPGRNGVPEEDVLNGDYSGKTIAQITSMVEHYTIDQPGSDDTLITKEVTVEKDTVTILAVADIAAGATLTLEATTNRAEDNLATVTLTGPDGDIALVSTEVTDGKVTADFDTTDFALGEWEVEVDVDGTIETATVNVLATAPTPTVTPTVTPTATPTAPSPTVTPTVTPDQIPGFEAVFAIAGLLAVAYLVLRREE